MSDSTESPSAPRMTHPAFVLIELSRRARQAGSAAELQFLAVNESHSLAAYRQAALWFSGQGVQTLSGVVQVEANAPYALWLNAVCKLLGKHYDKPTAIDADTLPATDQPEIVQEWEDWFPAHALWLPIAASSDNKRRSDSPAGGLLLARDVAWTEQEIALLAEWMDVWQHAWQPHPKPLLWATKQLGKQMLPGKQRYGWHFWRYRSVRVALLLLCVAFIPVPLTVLAPGELVPTHPEVIRAPLDGVIDAFHVQPNEVVRKGQTLFIFDEALIQSKLDVARQALATAETEYRQLTQQALTDSKVKSQLASQTGKIEEKRAEAVYLEEQLARATIVAPQDGVVLFDDPTEWIGRPVNIGERIMRIASLKDVEIEAWVPLSDAIPMAPHAQVKLYLNASPLSPVSAKLRYLSHDAVQRPDGSYAYRLRATLDEHTEHRVGLKGSAKLYGENVFLGYWVIRRPLASIRTAIGW